METEAAEAAAGSEVQARACAHDRAWGRAKGGALACGRVVRSQSTLQAHAPKPRHAQVRVLARDLFGNVSESACLSLELAATASAVGDAVGDEDVARQAVRLCDVSSKQPLPPIIGAKRTGTVA
eukprot:1830920-Pleurochrysis_carterae.AAC.1